MSNIIPIRLSHSTMDLINTCERKFQLEKLLITDSVREETEHTVLGTAYGAAVAHYLVHQDKDAALHHGWLAYWPELESDKKSVPHYVQAFDRSIHKLDKLLDDYEVAYFKGKPAIELSFRINVNPAYYYVGYVDVVLKNRHDGTYFPVDAKTTGLNLHDLSPAYQNSGQVLGYSIVVDAVAGEELSHYGCGYFVAQLKKDYEVDVHALFFRKTLLDRLNWFITLWMDIRKLELYEEVVFYPRRGQSCLKYNRQCKFFGIYTLSSADVPRQREVDEIEYDFTFDLDTLIDDHIQRINK